MLRMNLVDFNWLKVRGYHLGNLNLAPQFQWRYGVGRRPGICILTGYTAQLQVQLRMNLVFRYLEGVSA